MLTETVEPSTAHIAQIPQEVKKEKYLFHPIIDFLCLGGGSLILFAAFALYGPIDIAAQTASIITLTLATLINFPHFAHSYQIFYQNFLQKGFQQNGSRSLQVRYIFAGIVVPTALTVFFVTSVMMNDPQMLGFAGNILLFLVGWHYVKQGYGMIIVDSVLKSRYFTGFEKNVLLTNAYVCWGYFWLFTNWTISGENYWGLKFVMLTIPIWMIYAGGLLTAFSTAMVVYVLAKKRIRDEIKLPFNGTVAYFTSLYVWLALRLDPFFILLIPACHSLQYLIVVWRYQLNVAHAIPSSRIKTDRGILGSIVPSRSLWKFVTFVLTGMLLGFFSFWTLPQLLDSSIHYNQTVFGGTMFMFIFWIFLNIHHYFIDNVIWRRENPDTKRFLFGSS